VHLSLCVYLCACVCECVSEQHAMNPIDRIAFPFPFPVAFAIIDTSALDVRHL